MSQDFDNFKNSNSQSSAGSKKILQNILASIENELPSLTAVLSKLLLIHFTASILSLIVCPQFGVRLGFPAHSHSLMDIFMPLGHEACFFFCGAFYLGCSFLMAKLVFNADYWLVLKRSRLAIITTLAIASLGTFSMLGQKATLELTIIWFFGAYLGASLFTRDRFLLRPNLAPK